MVLPAWAVHVLWRILNGMFALMLLLKLISLYSHPGGPEAATNLASLARTLQSTLEEQTA